MKGFRNAAGAALVELVVGLPVLIALIVGTADFARVFYLSIELNNAARAGAQYATAKNGNLADANFPTIKAVAVAAAPNIGLTTAIVIVDKSCTCAPDDGTGQPWPNQTCSNTCVSGHEVVTVTVTAKQTFTMMSRFLPMLPSNAEIRRRATLRLAN